MNRTRTDGFSLVEVVVALGLLAGVLISISGLFIIGGKQVKSGRTSTEALAAGRAIVEQMNNWGFRQTYQAFGCTDTNNTCAVDTRTAALAEAQEWQDDLEAKLGPSAYAMLNIASLSQSGAPPAFNAAACRAIRVEVTVHWTEGGVRSRNVKLGAVRM